MGRSRGGLSTKIHLLADSRCRPLTTVITAGQRHDSLAFELVMDKVCVLRPNRGRPRRRPDELQADKAYSSKSIRAHLRARGIRATIPLKADRQAGRRRRGARGRLPAFDPEAYGNATSLNAPSTSSATPGQWPPATTKATSSTAAPSTSPRSGSGCETPVEIHLRDTP